jgi:hypothetical protein
MYIIFIFFILLFLLFLRFIKVYRFINKVSTLCYIYDWNYCIRENNEYLSEVLKEKYYEINEWSAINWFLYDGPTFIELFFSFKSLTLEIQYSKDKIYKLRKYGV